MIKKLKLSEDFYYLFDSSGEGVLFDYEVQYDFKDIIIKIPKARLIFIC